MRLKLTRFALTAVLILTVGLASVALAASGLTGMYTTTIKNPAQIKGKWVLAFFEGGTYTVALNGKAVARGKYTATAKTITFVRETGSGCTGSGTYAWKKVGNTLSFVRKREAPSCQGRAAVLAHPFAQVRSSS